MSNRELVAIRFVGPNEATVSGLDAVSEQPGLMREFISVLTSRERRQLGRARVLKCNDWGIYAITPEGTVLGISSLKGVIDYFDVGSYNRGDETGEPLLRPGDLFQLNNGTALFIEPEQLLAGRQTIPERRYLLPLDLIKVQREFALTRDGQLYQLLTAPSPLADEQLVTEPLLDFAVIASGDDERSLVMIDKTGALFHLVGDVGQLGRVTVRQLEPLPLRGRAVAGHWRLPFFFVLSESGDLFVVENGQVNQAVSLIGYRVISLSPPCSFLLTTETVRGQGELVMAAFTATGQCIGYRHYLGGGTWVDLGNCSQLISLLPDDPDTIWAIME